MLQSVQEPGQPDRLRVRERGGGVGAVPGADADPLRVLASPVPLCGAAGTSRSHAWGCVILTFSIKFLCSTTATALRAGATPFVFPG